MHPRMRSDLRLILVQIAIMLVSQATLLRWGRRIKNNNRGIVSALIGQNNKKLAYTERRLQLLASSLSGTELKPRQQQQQQQKYFQSSSSPSDEDESKNRPTSDDVSSLLIPPVFAAEDYTLYGGASSLRSTDPHHPHPLNPLFQDGVLAQLSLHQRIVTFGDVHGDLSKLIQFLVTAKVMKLPSSIEEALVNPTWCGGSTICIQVGDILDRGANELACIRLLSKLSKQAYDSGGALICLLGNHEALNAVGLFQYADPSGNLEFELCKLTMLLLLSALCIVRLNYYLF
jgi:hypothetical protein